MEKVIQVAGRILLAQIFILAGFNKIVGFAATQGYMESMGIPGALLPAVIVLELGGGFAVLLGWHTQLFCSLLAVFTVAAGFIFHGNTADHMQMIMLMKNLSIAGGLLVLASGGVHPWSLDNTARADR